MSVSSELSRLQAAKADIAAALAEKGVSVPAGSTLDAFGNLVRQVKTGSTVLSATFSADQWTGSADPYTLAISAPDRDGAAPPSLPGGVSLRRDLPPGRMGRLQHYRGLRPGQRRPHPHLPAQVCRQGHLPVI